MAFLTPDSLPLQGQCYTFSIDPALFSYVLGAMGELSRDSNWEQHGVVTPAEAAAHFAEIEYSIEDNCMIPWTFRGRRNTSWAVPHNTLTIVPYDSPEYLGGYDYVGGTVTVERTGLYAIHASLFYAASSAGQIQARINIDGGVNIINNKMGASGVPQMVQCSYVQYLTAGQTIQVYAFQNSGNSVNLAPNGAIPAARLSIVGLKDDWTAANE